MTDGRLPDPALSTRLLGRLKPLTDWAHAHPRRLSAIVLAVLAGTGVAAFGIAPLAPDAAQLPKRLVTEDVQTESLAPQLDALALHELKLQRSDLTRASDTVDSLLARLGVNDPSASAWLRSDATARRLFTGRAGKLVSARLAGDGRLQSLIARYPGEDEAAGGARFSRLRIERDERGWHSALEAGQLEAGTRLASGTIRSSLWAAADESNIPDGVTVQMAEMFSADIDFHRELRKGDTFSVVYEQLTADGEPINWNQGSGRVLAAEFINAGRSHQAVWFGADAKGKGGYYDFQGESKRRAFLASPMEFSRVTSGFAMRFHPILQSWRAHLGVDYGAPTGTPVRSVGEGVVEFAGVQNGYGNVVQIKHAGDRLTVYAHLSRIDVKKGQRVDQAQRIGAVGATGWATGPHLHFEFRVAGKHQDPLTIAKASETIKLDAHQKAQFAQLTQGVRAQLQQAEALRGQALRIE